MDKNRFFRECTLRICGSLDLDKALGAFFTFVTEFIPADEVYLHTFYYSRNVSTFFVKADRMSAKFTKIDVTWPDEVQRLIKNQKLPTQIIANKANQHPWVKYAVEATGKGRRSWITIRLNAGKDWIGGVSLIAKGWNRFTDEHLDLMSALREPFAIALSNYLRYSELLKLKDRLVEDKSYLESELRSLSGATIIGGDFGLKDVMDQVHRVASTDSPVLLLGETGVGKELIAAAIHRLSLRKTGPFIKVNCGAIPRYLMDSELFGHEKGAFTGAISKKMGRFERGHTGSIFLDEIGELSLEAQIRMLRVLQEKELERVGGNEPIKVDVRIIAATHRNLEELIKKRRFREDFYFRINVFPIIVPPLRHRKDDLPSLVQHFILKKSKEMKLDSIPQLAPDAMDRLMDYNWPGNVRELENAVERAIILKQGNGLSFIDLPNSAYTVHFTQNEEQSSINGNPVSLDDAMKVHIRNALIQSSGKIGGPGGAAETLGLKPGTLRARMRKLKIPFGRKVKY